MHSGSVVLHATFCQNMPKCTGMRSVPNYYGVHLSMEARGETLKPFARRCQKEISAFICPYQYALGSSGARKIFVRSRVMGDYSPYKGHHLRDGWTDPNTPPHALQRQILLDHLIKEKHSIRSGYSGFPGIKGPHCPRVHATILRVVHVLNVERSCSTWSCSCSHCFVARVVLRHVTIFSNRWSFTRRN